MRKAPDQHVQLVAAPTEVDEYDVIIKQLQEWHSQGYAWDDMAVLSRTKRPVRRCCMRVQEVLLLCCVHTVAASRNGASGSGACILWWRAGTETSWLVLLPALRCWRADQVGLPACRQERCASTPADR